MSNFYCHPGIAGGISYVGLIFRSLLKTHHDQTWFHQLLKQALLFFQSHAHIRGISNGSGHASLLWFRPSNYSSSLKSCSTKRYQSLAPIFIKRLFLIIEKTIQDEHDAQSLTTTKWNGQRSATSGLFNLLKEKQPNHPKCLGCIGLRWFLETFRLVVMAEIEPAV